MKLFYMDDSGSSGLNLDDPQQPLLVLGGVVIDDSKWAKVNKQLNEIKGQYGIGGEEIHALEIANSKGIFKGWDYNKKQNFIKQNLQLIADNELKILHFEVIKANYKNYFDKNFSRDYKKMLRIPPYIVAYSYILQIAEQYLQNANTNGILIADEQDVNLLANDTLKILRAIDEPEIKINRLVEKSFFINSRESNLLQLSDIVVYYIKRYFEIPLKQISQKSLEERTQMYNIIKSRIYTPTFDIRKHKILGFIKKRLDEEEA